MCGIISITATLVNVGLAMFVCFDVVGVWISIWFSGFECGAMQVRMRMFSGGEQKCIKNPTKIEKIRTQCRTGLGFVVACSFGSLKRKQKREKKMINHYGERFTLVRGKTKTGKMSKTEETSGKMYFQKPNKQEKTLENKEDRCVRECRFGGLFFLFVLERKSSGSRT